MGDPNTSVLLNYVKSGSGQQIIPLGNTNSNGTLSTTISSSNYSIVSNSSVHITLGGVNGVQSSNVLWPAVSSLISSGNMLLLSQTGVVLPVGQSTVVTVSNLNSSLVYLSNNSNPIIANVNISGSQITVLANSYGSTVAKVCLVSNSSNCGSIYITVQNSSASPLSFSQSSISMYSGQSISVQISGGSGNYLVLNNSSQNQGVVQSSISGATVTLTTTSTTGSSSITICSSDMSSCGILNVTIGNTSSSTLISFSQSNPTVIIGQSLNVSIYGPSSSLFYVSSNSNPNIVQANLSGNALTLLGIANGSSVISVCSSVSNCSSLTVAVNYSSGTNNTRLTLSQDNIYLSIGQTTSITISGGTMPYTISSNVNNIFLPTLNTNILTIYGLGLGSSTMNVCSSGGSCNTLSISVGGTSNVSVLPTGCLSASGYSSITGVSCSTSVLVSNYQTTSPSTSSTNTILKFTKLTKVGSTGTEVIELQKKLRELGFYKGKADGGFGIATEKAVKLFQKANGLSQVGSVGPKTRELLNK